MSDELDEVVQEFLVEVYESIDHLESELVELEANPDPSVLADVFRLFHTIKGTCGFLDFVKLETLAHAAETLLAQIRDGKVQVDAQVTSALLATVDASRTMLGAIEETGSDGDDDKAELIEQLKRLASLETAASPEAETEAEAEAETEAEAEAETEAEAEAEAETTAEPEPCSETKSASDADDSKASVESSSRPGGDARRSRAADSTIRVGVDLVDQLMNLVGELVLIRNQILQHVPGVNHAQLSSSSQRLNLITTELQEGVMRTRMQPINNVWGRLPRLVRDVAHECNKEVELVLEGRETELDKTIIEAIGDPLTHLVRNAVDHGIEGPERRRDAGKAATGTLTLRAFHEGGQVNIEITDDGAGIDVERVRAKAVSKGLLSSDKASAMSDREALRLIFAPGFSTAEKVTNVSGRGVGMDVVRTNIERIGGTVDVQSNLGQGTTFLIKIPLTLAIIPALTVSVRDERFAIPQVNLLELVRRDAESGTGIEMVCGAPVYRLRGTLLPVVDLASCLDLPERERTGDFYLVVLQAADRRFGLVVDEIHNTEEIVVKPLGRSLKRIPLYAGATIMGDGKVALILDTLGIAQAAGVSADQIQDDDADASSARTDDGHSLLLCTTGNRDTLAIPLEAVDRLEEVSLSKIEDMAGRQVVRHRGHIMPLVDLASAVGYAPYDISRASQHDDKINVIVFQRHGRHVGFVVEQLLDIVKDEVVQQDAGRRAGILGSAIVRDRLVELVDVDSVMRDRAEPLFGGAALI